jgi:hypothetical protein
MDRRVLAVSLVALSGIVIAATGVWSANESNGPAALTAADLAFLEKKIVARVEFTARGQFEAVMALEFDIFEHHPDPRRRYVTALVNAAQLSQLEATGAKVTVETDDWYDTYAKRSGNKTMGGMYTLAEVEMLMDSIHAAYPAITTAKFSIGTSFEGRDIWVMKFSDNPEVDEDEPEVLFDALHHARECITPMLLLETMRRLGSGYDSDSVITRLVDTREIYFCPAVNPDGFFYNQLIAPGGGGMWRKNRNDTYHASNVGVDLNRNYGYNWGYDDFGSSPNTAYETYRGPSAFSEPETQAMRDFINSREFVFVINYHSYSDLYLWPWGYEEIYSADDALFAAIGDSLGSFNGYTPQVGWQLYVTNGDSDDWCYGASGTEHDLILPYTPEVGSGVDGGFWPSGAQIPAQINETQAGNFLIMELANAPEKILPAELPIWVGPTDADTSFFDLVWTDNGGINVAASYRLRELYGMQRESDDAESGPALWDNDGFVNTPVRAASGTMSYYGGLDDWLQSHLTSKNFIHVEPGDTVTAKVWYDIETNWDYGYVDVSTNAGQTWSGLAGNITTSTNPNGNNLGNGITGSSGGVFVDGKFPLDAYIGQDILIRLSYRTDGFVLEEGIYFDDISPLVEFDSIVVLDPAVAQTSYAVADKSPGEYWYDLNGTDSENQTGPTTAPHGVTVDYNSSACDCSCHADPECNGLANVFDVVHCVNEAFRNGDPIVDPDCPRTRNDIDCNGVVNVFDVVGMVEVAFRNGDPGIQFCDPCAL